MCVCFRPPQGGRFFLGASRTSLARCRDRVLRSYLACIRRFLYGGVRMPPRRSSETPPPHKNFRRLPRKDTATPAGAGFIFQNGLLVPVLYSVFLPSTCSSNTANTHEPLRVWMRIFRLQMAKIYPPMPGFPHRRIG